MPLGCDDEEPVESGWQDESGAYSDRGPALGRSAPEESSPSVPAAPSASVEEIAIPEAVERSSWSFEIDGNAVTRNVTAAQLIVSGYYKVQLSEANLPRSSAIPSFQWVEPSLERSWPQTVTVDVPLDGRSHLVAWLDLDENGELSVGDRVSRPLEPLEANAASPIALRIDRIFVDPSAERSRQPAGPSRTPAQAGGNSGPSQGGGSQGYDGGPGLWGCAGSAPTGSLIEVAGAQTLREVEILLDPSMGPSTGRKAPRGSLIIYGFSPEQMNEHGMPKEDSQPTFVWIAPKKTKKWPAKFKLPVPDDSDMVVFAALDLDSNGRLSMGDKFGEPLKHAEAIGDDGSVRLVIGKQLGGAGPLKKRTLIVDLGDQGLPWGNSGELSTGAGSLLIYGYREDMLDDQGRLKPDTEPAYFWANSAQTSTWPVEVQVNLPEDDELLFLAAFDLDGDLRLGVGDYLGASSKLRDARGRGNTVRLSVNHVLQARNSEAGEASYGPPGGQR